MSTKLKQYAKENPILIFYLVLITLTMSSNIEHLTTVYYDISQKTGIWIIDYAKAFLPILVIDAAIAAFVREGRTKQVLVYTIALFIVKALYYKGFGLMNKDWIDGIAQLIFSGMFTYSIYILSEIFYEKLKEKVKKENLLAELQTLKDEISRLKEKLTKSREDFQTLAQNYNSLQLKNHEHVMELQAWKDRHTCKQCHQPFENSHSLSSHMKSCKPEIKS